MRGRRKANSMFYVGRQIRVIATMIVWAGSSLVYIVLGLFVRITVRNLPTPLLGGIYILKLQVNLYIR